MSKIIKAAELAVILSENEENIIRSQDRSDNGEPAAEERRGPLARAASSLETAAAKAESIIEDAQLEAQEIVEAARQEKETIRLQAKQEGWNEGYVEGQKTGRDETVQQSEDLIKALEHAASEAVQARAESLAQLEPDFLKLAVLLAEKIVRREIAEDPLWLKPVIEEALERLGAADSITVRIHPKDYLPLRDSDIQFTDYRGRLQFEPDDALKRGTLLFETEFGAIDASLEQRLGKLAESLLEVVYEGDE